MEFPSNVARGVKVQADTLLALQLDGRFMCLALAPYIAYLQGERHVRFRSNTLSGGPPFLGEGEGNLPVAEVLTDAKVELVFRCPGGATARMVPLTPELLAPLGDGDILGLTGLRAAFPSPWDVIHHLSQKMEVSAEYIEIALESLELPPPVASPA